MRKIYVFFKNSFGVLFFSIITLLLCRVFDQIVPLLIELGWASYLLVVFIESIIIGVLTLFSTILFIPFRYLITSKQTKICCLLISLVGLVYSLIIPWRFSFVYGFSFIVIVWDITLSVFIVGVFYILQYLILISGKNKRNYRENNL